MGQSNIFTWEFPSPGIRLLPALGSSTPSLWEKASLSISHSAQANIVAQVFPVLQYAVSMDACRILPSVRERSLSFKNRSRSYQEQVTRCIFLFNVGTR